MAQRKKYPWSANASSAESLAQRACRAILSGLLPPGKVRARLKSTSCIALTQPGRETEQQVQDRAKRREDFAFFDNQKRNLFDHMVVNDDLGILVALLREESARAGSHIIWKSEVILVDQHDDRRRRKACRASKASSIEAFSVFAFNSTFDSRSAHGQISFCQLWTNTCCSHQSPGEETGTCGTSETPRRNIDCPYAGSRISLIKRNSMLLTLTELGVRSYTRRRLQRRGQQCKR